MDTQSVDAVQRMGVVMRNPRSKCIALTALNNYSWNKLKLRNDRNEAIELEIMENLLISMILSFSFTIDRIARRSRTRRMQKSDGRALTAWLSRH